VTINNRDPTTSTNLKMIHIIPVLGLIAVIDPLTRRLDNVDVTNW